jgi:hypothetical protein
MSLWFLDPILGQERRWDLPVRVFVLRKLNLSFHYSATCNSHCECVLHLDP